MMNFEASLQSGDLTAVVHMRTMMMMVLMMRRRMMMMRMVMIRRRRDDDDELIKNDKRDSSPDVCFDKTLFEHQAPSISHMC